MPKLNSNTEKHPLKSIGWKEDIDWSYLPKRSSHQGVRIETQGTAGCKDAHQQHYTLKIG
jgi:hypothetical protein